MCGLFYAKDYRQVVFLAVRHTIIIAQALLFVNVSV